MPVARAGSARTTVDTPVTVPLLRDDVDPTSGAATVVLLAQPASGAVTCTALGCTYVPRAGFVGTDSFTYGLVDRAGRTATRTVTVFVGPGPRPDERPPARTVGAVSTHDGVSRHVGPGAAPALDPASDTGVPGRPGAAARALPRTGTEVGVLAAGGGAAVLLGALVLLAARSGRRRPLS